MEDILGSLVFVLSVVVSYLVGYLIGSEGGE